MVILNRVGETLRPCLIPEHVFKSIAEQDVAEVLHVLMFGMTLLNFSFVPISFNTLIICSLCVELNAFSKSTAAHCLRKFRFLS